VTEINSPKPFPNLDNKADIDGGMHTRARSPVTIPSLFAYVIKFHIPTNQLTNKR